MALKAALPSLLPSSSLSPFFSAAQAFAARLFPPLPSPATATDAGSRTAIVQPRATVIARFMRTSCDRSSCPGKRLGRSQGYAPSVCESWPVNGKGPDGEAPAEDAGGARADLRATLERKALTRDEARPEMIERRHAAGRRTARENIDDLVDPGSFVEYGALAIAAQRARREPRELFERTPADGLVAGVGRVNGEQFGERAACAVLSYDYTVLAGTQGAIGHRKKDRLFELIERMRLPTVFFAEGGGGRPGDTDYPVVSALDTRAFALWARLSGVVPRIAVVAGG